MHEFLAVIRGRLEEPNPESRDSGLDAAHRPGMTVERLRQLQMTVVAVAYRTSRATCYISLKWF
jgi:hypothetical protein